MNLLRRAACLLVALPAALALTSTSWADTWPSQPIRIVVPFPPGQNTDIVARYFAAKLVDALGKPVFADEENSAITNVALAMPSASNLRPAKESRISWTMRKAALHDR